MSPNTVALARRRTDGCRNSVPQWAKSMQGVPPRLAKSGGKRTERNQPRRRYFEAQAKPITEAASCAAVTAQAYADRLPLFHAIDSIGRERQTSEASRPRQSLSRFAANKIALQVVNTSRPHPMSAAGHSSGSAATHFEPLCSSDRAAPEKPR